VRPIIVGLFLLASAATPLGAQTPVREDSALTPDGVRLWYRVVGQGPETVIVPVGSYVGTRLDPLARGRRLVLYDPRNRLRSGAAPLERVGLDWQVRDLETIRQTVGAERAAIIGWSGLGMEAFVYALRHPDRVTRLVQLAPVPPRMDPWMDRMMTDRNAKLDTAAASALERRRAAGAFDADSAALCRATSRLSSATTFADPANVRLAPDVCAWPNEWPGTIGPYFNALLGSFGDFDWRPRLAEVTVPRLVIAGERDNIPVAGVEEWVAGQPNARLLLVPNAGHWPHAERPDLALPAIEEFLAGRWPGAAVAVPAREGQ
jgi:pimeloyl-ACP methyl ester carboxylesterase